MDFHQIWYVHLYCEDLFWDTVWGIHVTKWLIAWSLLLFLALHKVRFLRISRFIPDEICSNKAQSTLKIKLFLVVSALLCNLVWFSRTFGEWFLSKFMYIAPVAQMDSENILRMFSRIRQDRSLALTLPERTWFFVYSVLYLNKFHLVWIEIF